MSKERINQILREALAGGEKAVSGINPILDYKDDPAVEAILEYFEGEKDAKLVGIVGQGETWQMDIRCNIEPGSMAQFTREIGKQKAYDLKRGLEEFLLKKDVNIPIMSIQGIRTNNNLLEFSISFIYTYKGNVRDLNESREQRKSEILRDILKNIK